MIYSTHRGHEFEKVLRLLKGHSTEYLSGQELSDVLKISRVAVWKHVKKIRALGYKIESRQKLGYRLIGSTDLLLPWEISEGLKTEWIGKKIYYFDSIDSTQAYSLEIAGNAEENGTVVVAKRQTDGRGRMGRKWVSPSGGIWLSVIIRPESDFAITLFPIAAAVALAEAIEETLDLRPELKWPNDVLVDGKKTGGILVDVSMSSNRVDHMVLGVGVNFNINGKAIEKSIGRTENYCGAYSLRRQNTGAAELVRAFLEKTEKIFGRLVAGGEEEIIDKWTKRSSTIGKRVTLRTASGRISGNAAGIDTDGALILRQGKKTHRILAGDIIHDRGAGR